MARGGVRNGAGRKRGVPNKATAARQAQIAANGPTPLDVMLENMRFAHEHAAEVLAKVMQYEQAEGAEAIDAFRELLRFRHMAEDCAKDAAPYVHPRLSSIEHSGGITVARDLSDDELAAIAAGRGAGTHPSQDDPAKPH